VIRNIFKNIRLLILILVVGFSAFFAFNQYESSALKAKELEFAANEEWQWFDEYEHLQIRYDSEFSKSILRKVNLAKGYVIYATKDNDYNLITWVKFSVACKPNTILVTDEVFSNGMSKTLKCNSAGDALTFVSKWSDSDTIFTWSDNLGGFEFSENFTFWDFNKLNQEVTLLKLIKLHKKSS